MSLDAFARSMLQTPWQLGAQGVQLASSLFGAAGPAGRSASAAAGTSATQSLADTASQLVLGGYMAAQQLGTEYVSNPFSPVLDASRLAADSLSGCRPCEGGLLLFREYLNKSEVFVLVLAVPRILGLPSHPPFPSLKEIVERAYSHPPYPIVWLVEGSGKYYTDTFWAVGQVPQEILSLRNLRGITPKSRLMLNAGLGLSLAEHLGQGVKPSDPAEQIRRMIDEFLGLVRTNATPGSQGAALESLGLVTRMGVFTGVADPVQMVEVVSRELRQIDAQAWDYFWHGAGRSLYFNPVNFVPGHTSIWQAVEMLVRESPEGVARLSATAGYAWAVTLVNLRQPAIMNAFLEGYAGRLPNPEAFSYGIMTSIMMRYDTTPDDPSIRAFCEYRPECGDPSVWERFVSRPCRTGLQEFYPVLKRHNQLGQIFRFQDLGRLVENLKKRGGRS